MGRVGLGLSKGLWSEVVTGMARDTSWWAQKSTVWREELVIDRRAIAAILWLAVNNQRPARNAGVINVWRWKELWVIISRLAIDNEWMVTKAIIWAVRWWMIE
jgi:hypothetical protein